MVRMEGEEEKRLNTNYEGRRREERLVRFFKPLERRMNHEIQWRERDVYNLMFGKM